MKNRLARVNELIKRELDTLIRKDVQMPSKLVTVRDVDISPDLKNASIWMGIVGTPEEQYASMAKLHAARKGLQSELSRRVVLKFTPRLHFKLDEAGLRGDRILNILSDLNLPEPSPEQKEDLKDES